jgi:hypothetical protein
MKASKFVLSALLTIAVGLCSCQKSSNSAKTSLTGTYTLATINGKAVPCRPPREAARPAGVPDPPEIKGGSITLNGDATFSSTMDFGFRVANFNGTYTQRGSEFTLRWAGAGETTATLEGNTITMNNMGMLFAYRK